MSKLSVKELLAMKGERQLTQVFVTTPEEAHACEEAGIDLVIASERSDSPAIRAAAADTFLTIGLVFGDYSSADEAVRGGFRALRDGADAVYAGVGLGSVRAMANEGIPVVGHVGLVPHKRTWFGGLRPVGKTAAEAFEVYERTQAYEAAGAIAVEMELVPHRIAAEISKRVSIVVLSMGSGTGCDGQYLFATDILGANTGHVPRHAKVYRDFKAEYERLYGDSVAAFSEFRSDVESGAFPADEHLVGVDEAEYEAFLERLSG